MVPPETGLAHPGHQLVCRTGSFVLRPGEPTLAPAVIYSTPEAFMNGRCACMSMPATAMLLRPKCIASRSSTSRLRWLEGVCAHKRGDTDKRDQLSSYAQAGRILWCASGAEYDSPMEKRGDLGLQETGQGGPGQKT